MTNKNETMEAGWNLDNSYARLPNTFFTSTNPSPVPAPELIIFNESLAKSLGLNSETLQSEEGIAEFAGNDLPDGAFPIAQAYAGHQFGHFNMLGDGRAILLGEQITPIGERFDIQLKGAGRTPYSRGGDGRAALGPMLREHIISEAMYALGIPSTRSLAVVSTGQDIRRETELPGAILVRVATSHLRVGTFQYAASWGTVEDLRALADFAMKQHYPEIQDKENKYLLLLKEVIKRQASLIAKWQLIGFIHGVMNTDNMTISGETIDYGPCAFMNTYDPDTVFSSIDRQGRYAYKNQPPIGGWNLVRFAESLLPLLHDDDDKAIEIAQAEITKYMDLFQSYWLEGMRAKLGLFNEEKEDEKLISNLLDMMKKHEADYTNTFRALTFDKPADFVLFGTPEYKEWREQWEARLERQEESKKAIHELMRSKNPAVIPRNHRVEEALTAAVEKEDYSEMERFLAALSNPYAHTEEQEGYCTPPEPSNIPYRTYCGT